MIRVCLDVPGSDWIDLMPGSGSDTGTESLLTLCSCRGGKRNTDVSVVPYILVIVLLFVCNKVNILLFLLLVVILLLPINQCVCRPKPAQ